MLIFLYLVTPLSRLDTKSHVLEERQRMREKTASNQYMFLHEHLLSTNVIIIGRFWKVSHMCSTSNRESNEIIPCDSSKRPNNSPREDTIPQSEARINRSYLTVWSICWLNIGYSSKWDIFPWATMINQHIVNRASTFFWWGGNNAVHINFQIFRSLGWLW